MKIIGVFFVGCFLLLGLTSCGGQSSGGDKSGALNDGEKIYPFKSIEVEYVTQTEGMGAKGEGTRTMWIADYGRRQATLSHDKTAMSIMGHSSETENHTLSILDGNDSYSIDLITKTGVKGNVEEMKQMGKVMAASLMTDVKNMSLKDFVEKNGGTWHGQESFLGKTCDVFELMGTRQWHYQGIVLKVESTIGGMKVVEEAVSIKEDVAISDDRFKVPEGITITQAPTMDEMMQMSGTTDEE
ncbi:MAG: hypothetical protein JXR39_07790 [Marinilabiliaceae bacterium]|nr:hypothetical protein [Marinilabiliaceae bacterium]